MNADSPLGVDHTMTALILLREKIPYEVCRSIIGSAEHDKIYLCDIDQVLDYIDEEDAKILCNCGIRFNAENDCLSMFV